MSRAKQRGRMYRRLGRRDEASTRVRGGEGRRGGWLGSGAGAGIVAWRGNAAHWGGRGGTVGVGWGTGREKERGWRTEVEDGDEEGRGALQDGRTFDTDAGRPAGDGPAAGAGGAAGRPAGGLPKGGMASRCRLSAGVSGAVRAAGDAATARARLADDHMPPRRLAALVSPSHMPLLVSPASLRVLP